MVINIKTREVAEYIETHEIDLVQHGTHITGNGSWFTDDGTSGTETLIGSFSTGNELAFVELDVDDEQVPPEQEAPALGYAQNQVHAVYVDPYLKWVAVGGNGLKGITFTVWFERGEEESNTFRKVH
ncbi:hypothetical protein SARC_02570 [Sphaeroforma arctica JP610]|uniref:Uncharacterized protein n=1 Tax=Sphaeroforma arctica JP610 TaxID=667725 RepID=A0A0L0G8A9_9EUKA|nr:hypothetical protein SARC_02570 [Sphaeroforma arctica JP610]KNC85235.1 hypothetical protein SARC_02570 [Sphaeroforma arctica JP610]|eukprot:XP_014159137.1 hypothetical protein SARC_02570 [Sphaeroforma arctica JP610]